MAHDDNATIIGFMGVSLLLIAFLLNLIKIKAMRAEGWSYLALNFIGAGFACYSSYLIRFMPFVVLEGTWAFVAMMALARKSWSRPAGA